MLTLEQARKIDPSLEDLTNEQLQAVITELEEMAKLALENYLKESGSKIPYGILPDFIDKE